MINCFKQQLLLFTFTFFKVLSKVNVFVAFYTNTVIRATRNFFALAIWWASVSSLITFVQCWNKSKNSIVIPLFIFILSVCHWDAAWPSGQVFAVVLVRRPASTTGCIFPVNLNVKVRPGPLLSSKVNWGLQYYYEKFICYKRFTEWAS